MKLRDHWCLFYEKDASLPNEGKDFSCEADLKHLKSFENVAVPTLFEWVLFQNKVLGHPYYSTNTWDYQTYEDVHQFYVTHFKSNKKRKVIIFEGIDTVADIFVNGKKIGHTNNQFTPFIFELDDLKEENELLVHIYPNALEAHKYPVETVRFRAKYGYDSVYLRKTPSSFGWDIMARTLLGGIFRDVVVKDSLDLIDDVHVVSKSISKEKAVLGIEVSLNRPVQGVVSVYGACEDSAFDADVSVNGTLAETEVVIKNPKLWTIRGYGKPYLYAIDAEVSVNDKVVAKKSVNYGIRKVELKRSSIVEEGGCFEFYINDQKVFLLGSNWVPIEAINHIDDARMKKTLKLIDDIGCNALRVWGGGTYESDAFYDLCDRMGIFVWQDFMMGCGTYPQDEEFCGRLKTEAEYVVKHLRNHASICLWAGDNENDLASAYWCEPDKRIPANKNVLTRKVLPEVISRLDGTRPYLPSSPYIDEKAEQFPGHPSEDHVWGPRDYFKSEFYKTVYPYFASETGYHALNSPASLRKFLKKTWPLFDGKMIYGGKEVDKETREYLAHATSIKDDYDSPYEYRIRLMRDQVATLFTREPKTLKKFALASQISQAEAMKFFIEKMRKDMVRNGGIIWWNIMDGWPQVSDAVVDYYFCKKLAYGYIKRSQSDSLLMMEEVKDAIDLYFVSQKEEAHTYEYEIIDGYTGEKFAAGEIVSKPYTSMKLSSYPRDDKHHFYILKSVDESGNVYLNHFHTNILNIDLEKYVVAAKKYGLIKLSGF